eukprot:g8784.t1
MTIKIKLYILCFGLFALRLLSAEDEHVIVLNVDNFDSVVSQGDVVVEFHAPGCGHCQKVAPEYEKAAQKLKEKGSSIILANLDASIEEHKPIAQKYGIMRFPTFKLFKKGSSIDAPEEFDGPRDAEGLVKTLKKAFGPPSVYFSDMEDLKKFAYSDDVTVVGFFTGEDSKAFQTYVKVAKNFTEDIIEILHTFRPDVASSCGKNSKGCEGQFLTVHNSRKKEQANYEGAFEEEPVYRWIARMMSPPLIEYDGEDYQAQKNLGRVLERPEPRLIGYSLKSIKDTSAFKKALVKADAADDSFNVIYIDANKNKKAAEYFDLTDEDYPAIVIHEHSVATKYIKKNCLPSDVSNFVAQWKAGELTESLKSEEIPADNAGPVKVVVAKEYRSFINAGKNAFVEFYDPENEYCKELEPVFEDLGKHYQKQEDIVIAKMDAIANDVPDPRFKIRGYPILKYFSKDGDILDFVGDTTLSGFIDFINKALVVEQKETTSTQDKTNEQKDEL